jgi:hypothetical protein
MCLSLIDKTRGYGRRNMKTVPGLTAPVVTPHMIAVCWNSELNSLTLLRNRVTGKGQA